MTLYKYNLKVEGLKKRKNINQKMLKTFLKAVGVVVKTYGPPDDFRLIINSQTKYKWLIANWKQHTHEVVMGEEMV